MPADAIARAGAVLERGPRRRARTPARRRTTGWCSPPKRSPSTAAAARSPSTAQPVKGALYRRLARTRSPAQSRRPSPTPARRPLQLVTTVSGVAARARARRVARLRDRAHVLHARRQASRPRKLTQNQRVVVVLKVTESGGALRQAADRRPAAGRARDRQSRAGRRRLDRGLRLAEERHRAGARRISRRPLRRRYSTASRASRRSSSLAYVVRASRPAITSIRRRRPRTCTPRTLRPHRLRRGRGDGEVRQRRSSGGRFASPSPSGRGADGECRRIQLARARRARGGATLMRLRRLACRAGCVARAVVFAFVAGARLGLTSPGRAMPHRSARSISRLARGLDVVVDRDGRLLRAFTMPDGRWRLPATTHDVDPRYLAMLIAYEDGRFYAHHGVDWRALAARGRAMARRAATSSPAARRSRCRSRG